MLREQCVAMVRGYLDEGQFTYTMSPDGTSFRLPWTSTAVYIDFFNVGAQTGVWVHAPLIEDVKKDAPLGELAKFNTQVTFAKFGYYEQRNSIELDHDLVADTLEGDELRHVVRNIGDLADEWDDKLLPDFGGRLHSPPEDPAQASTDAVDV